MMAARKKTASTPGPAGPQGSNTVTEPLGPAGMVQSVGLTDTTESTKSNKTGSTNKPTKPTKPDTGGTSDKEKNTVTVKGEKVVVGGKKWKKIIQEEFGSLWDVYNDNADVRKVIDRSVKEGWFNDANKVKAALSSTNWYRTTQASVRQFMTRQSTDPATLQADINTRKDMVRQSAGAQGYSLSDEAIARLAEDSIKYNYSETQLGNAIGSEAVAQATAGGATGMAELRKGQIGTQLKETAYNYAYTGDDRFYDGWVQRIASGQSNMGEYEQFIKSQASSYYKSLAPQIDRGIDVRTATTMYRNQAANTLKIDPEAVDWTQDKWNKALNYQDPKTGEYRQMDSWEWNRYLRSLPEWQETDDAKQTYRNAAFTLAQAFGRTS